MMIKYFVKSLVVMTLALGVIIVGKAQSKSRLSAVPQILQVAAPIYPNLAIQLDLEQQFTANFSIDRGGKVYSVHFDRGDKNFQTVVRDALISWRFVRSKKKVRTASVMFIFKLLPSDSKAYVSTIIKSGNTVEVYARKPKILDVNDK
jgi:hypothetical protein